MKATILSDLQSAHRRADLDRRGPLEFRLIEPLVVEIDGVRYRAPAGSTTDGASTPRVFRNLVPRVGRHIYGAIVHDSAYRGVLEELWVIAQSDGDTDSWRTARRSRQWADHAFLAIMVAAGTGAITRRMAYWAVRLFGRRAFQGGKA